MIEIIAAAALQLAILTTGTTDVPTTESTETTQTETTTTTATPIGNNGWGDDNN